ncbi:MAG: tetratricopeptide repeat protein, partial [Flammeovirgaceae bacterium]
MNAVKHKLWPFCLLTIVMLGCESKETRLQQFLLKGNLAAKEFNYNQAAYYYEEAIKLDGCYADAHNNLGTINFQQKKWEQALANYNRAIECK